MRDYELIKVKRDNITKEIRDKEEALKSLNTELKSKNKLLEGAITAEQVHSTYTGRLEAKEAEIKEAVAKRDAAETQMGALREEKDELLAQKEAVVRDADLKLAEHVKAKELAEQELAAARAELEKERSEREEERKAAGEREATLKEEKRESEQVRQELEARITQIQADAETQRAALEKKLEENEGLLQRTTDQKNTLESEVALLQKEKLEATAHAQTVANENVELRNEKSDLETRLSEMEQRAIRAEDELAALKALREKEAQAAKQAQESKESEEEAKEK